MFRTAARRPQGQSLSHRQRYQWRARFGNTFHALGSASAHL